MLGPVLAGLAGTLAPAFGYMPALGAGTLGLWPFQDLMHWPGLLRAVQLSVLTGLLTTAVSLVIAMLLMAGWHGTRAFIWLERLLSPLLSVPHAAAAFGIVFMIAPSGWIARVFSPWATGWSRPPDVLILQDSWGLSMALGLIAKELPFLLLMALAALPQTRPNRSMTIAYAMGYGRISGWLKTIFPNLYAQIRLPVYAVLAYSMTVVDVAIILGPNTPPPLSVQVVRWMSDPDLGMRHIAAAGAVVQFALVIGVLVFWRVMEGAVSWFGLIWIKNGARGQLDAPLRLFALLLGVVLTGAILLGLVGLGIWSLSGLWVFPDPLPQALNLKNWMRHAGPMLHPTLSTLVIGGAATAVALTLTLGCLEAEYRYRIKSSSFTQCLLYLPLLVPQVAFLPGLQTLALITGVDMGIFGIIMAHVVFVLPYIFLALSDPYRTWDARNATIAQALGSGANGVFWRVRFPMLLGPILTAAAVGFAVSVGQYLPTLLIGAGRVQTLTTEAVALASGGDRRAIGVYAIAQTAVVMGGFLIALLVPKLLWSNRRGVTGGI